MDLIRNIGNYEIMVDCNKPHDIYFEQGRLEGVSNELSQINICQILSKDKARPLFLKWEITDKCNFSCPFCYIVGHSQNGYMRFDKIRESLNDLLKEGLLYCLLTGGEAMIHPDFIEIYLFLKKQGVVVEIYTNGSFITPEHITVFKEFEPYKIEVTIYGITDEVFQRNTKSTCHSGTVLENILRLKNAGINVSCKTPINKLTIAEIEEIISWCESHEIRHYYSSDIIEAYDSADLSPFGVDKTMKRKYDLQNELQFREKYGHEDVEHTLPESIKKSFSCSVGSYGILISSDFKLYPCGAFSGRMEGYDILHLGVRNSLEQLNQFISLTYKTDIIGCYGCEYSTFCKMCPAIAKEVVVDGALVGYATDKDFCDDLADYFSPFRDITGDRCSSTQWTEGKHEN